MRFSVFSLLSMVSLVAAATAQEIDPDDMLIKKDEFKGHHVWLYTKESNLDDVTFGSLELRPQKFISANGQTTYQLIITYRDDDWIFIEDTQPLEVLANGKLMKLQSVGETSTDVNDEGGIRETQMYALTESQLRGLAGAQLVKIQVTGRKVNVRGTFSKDNFRVLRGFVAQYVDGTKGRGGAAPARTPASGSLAPKPAGWTKLQVVDMPPGTMYIADGQTKTYYPMWCPAIVRIAPADRLFYASGSPLRAAGLTPAKGCL